MKWDKKIKPIYVKITDKYIYLHQTTTTKYECKYIKNGTVDNVNKFQNYLQTILKYSFIKKKYIFILDSLLSNSDKFVYNYVFENLGLINYKIISDIDIIKNKLTDENIIIMNWSSTMNYAYKCNDEIIVNRLNISVINSLKKKYILLCGDTKVSDKIKIPILTYEYGDNVIFNYL